MLAGRVQDRHDKATGKTATRITLEIEKESELAKGIYDLRCLMAAVSMTPPWALCCFLAKHFHDAPPNAQILSKLCELQVVSGSVKVNPNYVLAIANNVRSQIEESQCTIATTKLVMTWSALMTVYILSKLRDQLVKQGPVSNPYPRPSSLPFPSPAFPHPAMVQKVVVHAGG